MKRNLLATAVGLLLASTAGATILEWSPEEKRVYFEKREAFTFQTEIEAQDAFQLLRQTYYLPQAECSYVQTLMVEREMRKATYNYINDNPWDRVANKK